MSNGAAHAIGELLMGESQLNRAVDESTHQTYPCGPFISKIVSLFVSAGCYLQWVNPMFNKINER